jgi:hypothetical protein
VISAPVVSAVNAPVAAPVPVKKEEAFVTNGGSQKKRPAPQWEQHTPGANDEMQVDPANKTHLRLNGTKAIKFRSEQLLLPEWFDVSAPHRTHTVPQSSRDHDPNVGYLWGIDKHY